MRPLPGKTVFLPLLPQSQLSEVSPRSDRALDCQTAATVTPMSVLPDHLHSAGLLASVGSFQPKLVYGLLMKTAAAALQKLADDPRFLGARLGALAVLHTWTRAMLFHPHVHMLVTAGGLSADGHAGFSRRTPSSSFLSEPSRSSLPPKCVPL